MSPNIPDTNPNGTAARTINQAPYTPASADEYEVDINTEQDERIRSVAADIFARAILLPDRGIIFESRNFPRELVLDLALRAFECASAFECVNSGEGE